MREILFRAKRADTGEWVYGGFSRELPNACPLNEEEAFIIDWSTEGPYKVLPDTVGQYTGMNDKNGRRIYDGDIIQVPIFCSSGCNVLMKGIVEFHKSAFSVLWEDAEYGRRFIGYLDDMEVIGNIFDNNNLLDDKQTSA